MPGSKWNAGSVGVLCEISLLHWFAFHAQGVGPDFRAVLFFAIPRFFLRGFESLYGAILASVLWCSLLSVLCERFPHSFLQLCY